MLHALLTTNKSTTRKRKKNKKKQTLVLKLIKAFQNNPFFCFIFSYLNKNLFSQAHTHTKNIIQSIEKFLCLSNILEYGTIEYNEMFHK